MKKVLKRGTLTVRNGKLYRSVDDVYVQDQWLVLMFRHRNDPGRFYNGFGMFEREVSVRWLWTGTHGYFAPEISFRPTLVGAKLAKRVADVLYSLGRNNQATPAALQAALAAVEVVYDKDDDYVLVPPMETAK